MKYIKPFIWIVIALAIFYALFCSFLIMVRDLEGEPVHRKVTIDPPDAGAPIADNVEEVNRFTIYRDGDGPAPEWYCPNEPMAAEWSAADNGYLLNVPLDAEFQSYLRDLCEEYGVPFTLAVAVIEAESSYQPDVISDDGDYGLMQINWRCHSWLADELGIVDFLNPYQNALAGVWILGGYHNKYGADSGTLIAYNQGQQSAEALFAEGIYETNYSRRVMGIQRRLEADGR